RSQNYSEETARKIDKEIYDIVEAQFQRSLQILREHRKALDVMADALLEHETIDGKHVHEILEFGEMRSPIVKREIVKEEPEPEAEEGESKKKKKKENDNDGGL